MAPLIVDKEAKKEEIFAAAAVVFADKGFTNTRMEDVARQADIGKGTLYEYFRSKDALFFDLYQHLLDKFHQKIYAALAPDQTSTQALDALISSTLRAFAEWQDYGVLLLEFWNEHRRGKFLEVEFAAIYDKSRGIIRELIEAGVKTGEFAPVDSWVMASTIIAVLDGVMLQRVFDPDLFSKFDLEDNLSTILFAGLKAR